MLKAKYTLPIKSNKVTTTSCPYCEWEYSSLQNTHTITNCIENLNKKCKELSNQLSLHTYYDHN